MLSQYNEYEIESILNSDTRLVYVDTGLEEFVARYIDLPDIIVDINDKFMNTNLKVYDFENPDMYNPLLTTFGEFLNECRQDVRRDIIDRLMKLQLGTIDIKKYKVIDEDMLDDVRKNMGIDYCSR